jgi:hypothetical protein
MRVRIIAALSALALIAVPAGAMGKKSEGSKGKGKGKPAATQGPSAGTQQYCDPFGGKGKKKVAYVARGVVKDVDPGAGTVTLTVAKRGGATNKHARSWRGDDVTFLVNCAKLKVRDTNGDGNRDLADVKTGDSAAVLAKLPRKLGSSTQPYLAKQLRVERSRR